MHISLTRVFLESLIAFYMSGHLCAMRVMMHYSSKVSVKNGKTLQAVIDKLKTFDDEKKAEYFKLLSYQIA